MEEILENPDVTQAEIANKIGLSIVGVRYAIKQLKEKEIVRREGTSRSGRWIFIDDHNDE